MPSSDQLFDQLPEEERRAVRTAARRRKFGRGDTIFYEGDPGDTLHVIEKGHVAIRVSTPMGEVVTLTVLGRGEAFGDQALIVEDSRRTASAVCLDSVETLSINNKDFEALRVRLPSIDRFLIGVLSAQVRRLSEMLTDSLHLDADTRVWRRLHDLAAVYSDGSDVGVIVLPITQDDLASLAGTTRPTTNKALKVVEDAGIVELSRGKVSVVDLPGLAKRAKR